MEKDIKLTPETHRKLMLLKAEKGFSSADALIVALIKFYKLKRTGKK